MNEIVKEQDKTGLEVITYNVNDAKIAAVTAKYTDVIIIPDDPVTYETVMKGLSEHRAIRIAVEKRRDELTKATKKAIATRLEDIKFYRSFFAKIVIKPFNLRYPLLDIVDPVCLNRIFSVILDLSLIL